MVLARMDAVGRHLRGPTHSHAETAMHEVQQSQVAHLVLLAHCAPLAIQRNPNRLSGKETE
jgi:hypothetical protein